MKIRMLISSVAAGSLVVAGLASSLSGASAGTVADRSSKAASGRHAERVCAASTATRSTASCLSKVMVNGKGAVPESTTPPTTALTPAQLQDAYKLAGTSGAGRTVAVVDAYGYPNLERDLATYRSYFGAPALHDRHRLPQGHRPERWNLTAPLQRRLGR